MLVNSFKYINEERGDYYWNKNWKLIRGIGVYVEINGYIFDINDFINFKWFINCYLVDI